VKLIVAETSTARSPTPDGVTRAWNGLITIVGASAGIAALVYFVGAVAIWARLRAAGLPADIGVEHQARGEVIAVGVRGIAVITFGIALAAAFVYMLLLGVIYYFNRKKTDRTPALEATLRETNVLNASADGVKRLGLAHFRLFVLAGAIVVFCAAFASWHLFAGAIAAVTVIGASLAYLHERRHRRTRPSLALVVITLLALGAAGTAWQIQPPVYVQAAIVAPIPEAKGVDVDYLDAVKGVALPYLGETSTHVYIAEVTKSSAPHRGRWIYTRRILEFPRDGVRLTFPEKKGTLYPQLSSPGIALWHAFF
jgi:hypothetical protein